MSHLTKAAISDYNANITATKDAASREMLDTVVSVVAVGGVIERQVVISNPHVLKPVANWRTGGGTPLYGGILNIIALFQGLPDANNKDVSFLVLSTTDGEATDSELRGSLVQKIAELQRTGRWTFVFRVPKGARYTVSNLGVSSDNIVEWDTTEAGMAAASAQTQQAMNTFYTARSAGAQSSTVFYANAAQVNTQALMELDPKEFSLYVVPANDQGIMVSDFILRHRQQYLKGGAFYQLTKTEPRVSHTKLILVRDRTTGKVYAGNEARQMIGLPTHSNARLHPGDHKNFDIFIQSESWNRKLVAGTGVIYWAKQGVPFTQADLDKFTKPAAPVAPAVVQLPAVAPTNKPTPSPIPVAAKAPVHTEYVNGKRVKFFKKRGEARAYARANKLPKGSLGDTMTVTPFSLSYPERWFVYL